MPQVTEPVSPKPGFQRGSLCSQGPIPLDALDLPRGCRLFQSKSSAGMQPPTGRKSRRTMTSLRPGLGWWEPGSPAFAPNPQLLPKGKEGSHQPCPLGQGAEQFAEALPSSREGRVTRGGPPQDRGLPVAGVPMAASVGLRGLFSDLPGKFCRQCLEASVIHAVNRFEVQVQGKRVWSCVSEGRTRRIPAAWPGHGAWVLGQMSSGCFREGVCG